MRLTLRLTAHGADQDQSRTLDQGQMSIGRGAENDWVLADPDRTLSKQHCRIDVSQGGFMLTDLSTNGVFLAGSAQAIGRGHSCALEDGDVFALGPYKMVAAIDVQATPAGSAASTGYEAGFDPLLPGQLGDVPLPGGFAGSPVPSMSPIEQSVGEPWLEAIPGGDFGPGRRAAAQGWDAPPDPATYAASGLFERPDPLDPRSFYRSPTGQTADHFSHSSEHVSAASTVMRLPASQVVLPTNWMDGDPADSAPTGISATPISAAPLTAAAIPAFAAPLAPSLPGPAEQMPEAVQAWPTLPDDDLSPEQVEEQLSPSGGSAVAAPGWPPLPSVEAPLSPTASGALATLPPVVHEPTAILPPEWTSPPTLDIAAPFVADPAPMDPWAVKEPAQFPRANVAHAPEPPPETLIPQRSAPVAVATEAPPAANGPSEATLVAAFLAGAGLPPETLAGADLEAGFRNLGGMVRAAVDGVRDILSTRALIKSEFRVDQTVLRRSDNNAMKFAPDSQSCLAAMVGVSPPGFLPGSAAMQQSMDDIKLHELALVAALNSVFADLSSQFDPETIMTKARQDGGIGTMLPYARDAKCWAIYVETHRLLQDSGATNTAGSLLAPLALAYARQLRRAG